MNEFVIDCSISAKWILPDEQNERADAILEAVVAQEICLVQPELWWYEMLNLLRSAVRRNRLSQSSAERALALLLDIPLLCIGTASQSKREVLNLAIRHGLSAYDASYVCIATSRSIPLVSADSDILALRDQPGFTILCLAEWR